MAGRHEAEYPSASSISTNLLRQIKSRDPDGWHRLADEFGPVVYGWVRALGVPSSDAPDLVQEVFRAVLKGIDRFERNAVGHSFRGWLWTIARNKVLDDGRQRQLRPEAVGGSDAQHRLGQIPDKTVEDESSERGPGEPPNEVVRAMSVVQSEFEARTWQAFWRIVVEGESVADVAVTLGMSKAAVYQAKSRVLRRMRQELKAQDA